MSDVLAEYWGARWPDVRSELEASGFRLDQAFDPASLKPWEEARELLAERIEKEFVDPADADSRLRMFFGVGDALAHFPDLYRKALERGATVEELSARAGAHSHLVDVCKADYLAYRESLAAHAKQRLMDPSLPKAPFKLPGSHVPAPEARPFLLKKSFASWGWVLSLVIYEGEDPTVDAAYAQFLRSAEAWRNAVSAALAQ